MTIIGIDDYSTNNNRIPIVIGMERRLLVNDCARPGGSASDSGSNPQIHMIISQLHYSLVKVISLFGFTDKREYGMISDEAIIRASSGSEALEGLTVP
jgi:hypothetical protein